MKLESLTSFQNCFCRFVLPGMITLDWGDPQFDVYLTDKITVPIYWSAHRFAVLERDGMKTIPVQRHLAYMDIASFVFTCSEILKAPGVCQAKIIKFIKAANL